MKISETSSVYLNQMGRRFNRQMYRYVQCSHLVSTHMYTPPYSSLDCVTDDKLDQLLINEYYAGDTCQTG